MGERRKSLQVAVGEQVRLQRLGRGLSLAQLARIIGVSEAELAAYERGDKRISSGVLWDLAEALDVPLSSLFETYEPGQPRNGETRQE